MVTNGVSQGDFNNNGKVYGEDYILWISNYGKTSTPLTIPPQQSGEWSQFASTPQKTSYTLQIPATPLKIMWEWNGADADGRKPANHLSAPYMIQPSTRVR